MNRLGNIYGNNLGVARAGNVWDTNGICQALLTCPGGGIRWF